jgi:prephenate dehydrogenase
MEIGFPSKPVPELREWRQDLEDDESDEDCVFGCVPVEKILETIEKHGGCEQLESVTG